MFWRSIFLFFFSPGFFSVGESWSSGRSKPQPRRSAAVWKSPANEGGKSRDPSMTTKRKRVNEYNKWEKDHGTHNSEVQNSNRMKLWIQWYHEALFVAEKTLWCFLPDASFHWHWELLGWLQPSKKSEKTWRSTSVFGDGFFNFATFFLQRICWKPEVFRFLCFEILFSFQVLALALYFSEKKTGENGKAELSAHFKWTAQGDLQNADTLGKIIFWQLVSCHFYRRKASFPLILHQSVAVNH